MEVPVSVQQDKVFATKLVSTQAEIPKTVESAAMPAPLVHPV